jgi:hypothetical protein
LGEGEELDEAPLLSVLREINTPNAAKLSRTPIHDTCLDQNYNILKMHISKIEQNSQNMTKASTTTRIATHLGNGTKKSTTYNKHVIKVLDALDYYGNNSLSLACTYSAISNDVEKHKII